MDLGRVGLVPRPTLHASAPKVETLAKSSIVGELINFRGLVYGPVNEMGVVALFAKVGEELGFIIEEIRAEFPDCIARRQVDKGWEG